MATTDIEYTCELKVRWSFYQVLTYEAGNQFVKAVTRGDGFQGDDVTANIKTNKSVNSIDT